jgi:hypothetical protein
MISLFVMTIALNENDTIDHMKTKFEVTIINVDMYVWLCIHIDHI